MKKSQNINVTNLILQLSKKNSIILVTLSIKHEKIVSFEFQRFQQLINIPLTYSFQRHNIFIIHFLLKVFKENNF